MRLCTVSSSMHRSGGPEFNESEVVKNESEMNLRRIYGVKRGRVNMVYSVMVYRCIGMYVYRCIGI